MKTTTFVLFSAALILLSACMPGDGEVLSPSERGLKVSSDAIILPKVVDISGGILIEARHAQAVQLVKKSMQVLESSSAASQDGCVAINLVNAEASLKNYQIEYQNCSVTFDGKTLLYAGKAQLKIEMDDAETIKSISYSTPRIADKSPDALIYKLDGARIVTIQDESEMVLEQTAAGVFMVRKLTGQTFMQAESVPVTSVTLAMETTSGAYVFSDTGEVSTQFETSLTGEGLASGKLSDFSVKLEKKAESTDYNYSVTFNFDKKPGKAKVGTLSFADEALTYVPNGKKPETKVRPKNSEKLDGALPWTFWL